MIMGRKLIDNFLLLQPKVIVPQTFRERRTGISKAGQLFFQKANLDYITREKFDLLSSNILAREYCTGMEDSLNLPAISLLLPLILNRSN